MMVTLQGDKGRGATERMKARTRRSSWCCGRLMMVTLQGDRGRRNEAAGATKTKREPAEAAGAARGARRRRRSYQVGYPLRLNAQLGEES